MILGVNTDFRHWHDLDRLARDIRAVGFLWIRSVFLPGPFLYLFLLACRAAGLQVLLVVARESLVGGSFEATAKEATKYAHLVAAWEIGNEWDQESPSSWDLPGSEVTRLGRCFRTELPGALLVLGGQVSGDPNYLEDVDLSVFDGDALHTYGERPDGWSDSTWGFGWAAELIDNYCTEIEENHHYPLPIWITEYGAPADDLGGSEAVRSHYYGAMAKTFIRHGRVLAAFPFKWEDDGVEGFGLLDLNRKPRPALTVVSAIALSLASSDEEESPTVTIEELATKPQRDDPDHEYGIWGKIEGNGPRFAWANTPEWLPIIEINGEAVVIEKNGEPYRPQ